MASTATDSPLSPMGPDRRGYSNRTLSPPSPRGFNILFVEIRSFGPPPGLGSFHRRSCLCDQSPRVETFLFPPRGSLLKRSRFSPIAGRGSCLVLLVAIFFSHPPSMVSSSFLKDMKLWACGFSQGRAPYPPPPEARFFSKIPSVSLKPTPVNWIARPSQVSVEFYNHFLTPFPCCGIARQLLVVSIRHVGLTPYVAPRSYFSPNLREALSLGHFDFPSFPPYSFRISRQCTLLPPRFGGWLYCIRGQYLFLSLGMLVHSGFSKLVLGV